MNGPGWTGAGVRLDRRRRNLDRRRSLMLWRQHRGNGLLKSF